MNVRLVLRLFSQGLRSNGEDLGSSGLLEKEELNDEEDSIGDHLGKKRSGVDEF